MKTLREIIKQDYKEDLADIAEHGCASGFGPIYYNETNALYDKHKYEIWGWLQEEADNMGYDNPIKLIDTFKGNIYSVDDMQQVLVWAYFEQVAMTLLNENEKEAKS